MLNMIIFQCGSNFITSKLRSSIRNYISWEAISYKYVEQELYDEIFCSSRQCLCFNPFGDIFCCHQDVCFLIGRRVNWTKKTERPSFKWFNNQLGVQGHFISLSRASCSLAVVEPLLYTYLSTISLSFSSAFLHFCLIFTVKPPRSLHQVSLSMIK